MNTTTRRVMVKTSMWSQVIIPQEDIDNVGGDINKLELEDYSIEEDRDSFEWEEDFNILDYDPEVDGGEMNIFLKNNVLVCRSSNTSDLQYSFSPNSQQTLLNTYEEFLEDHFQEEDRDTHRLSTTTFRQFIEEKFEVDEMVDEFNMEIYHDICEGFGRNEEDPQSVQWSLRIYPK